MNGAEDFPLGSTFAGRYRLVRRIAAGGMGAVYEVVHIETDRRRALKVMHANLFQSEEWRERFKREAKVAAQIDSEFIVDVFDAGIDEPTGTPFLVMELLRGEELGERLKRQGKLAPTEALGYLRQIAFALEKTHQASIVHRDLKPANVFLVERSDGGRQVKILDFGIAKMVAEGATAGGATQSLGTPQYMAPEQLNPHARLSGAADIYALGMMTYTLLVGVPYWTEEARGGNMYALLAVASRGPTELATIRASRHGVTLPSAFDPWFARATAFVPTLRFPSAMEAIQALAEVLRVPMLQLVETPALLPPSAELGTKDLHDEVPFHESPPQTVRSSSLSKQSTALISPSLSTRVLPSPSSSSPIAPLVHMPDVTIGGASTSAPVFPKRARIIPVVAGAVALIAGAFAGFITFARMGAKSEAATQSSASGAAHSAWVAPNASIVATANATPSAPDPVKPESVPPTTKASVAEAPVKAVKPTPKPTPVDASMHKWDP